MKKPVKYALIGLGVLELFVAALFGFAILLGAHMHRLPLVGAMFPDPAQAEGPVDHQAALKEPIETPPKPQIAKLGVLETFSMQAPYSSSELKKLVEDLKAKDRELELRHGELNQRESILDQRAELLDEKYADLRELFGRLEERAEELDLREAEIGRAEDAKTAREEESWDTLSQLFADGDAEELSGKLLGYEPEQAARLLQRLDPDRAKELLEALPEERWQAYAEAFSAIPSGPAKKGS
jgi:hypothetical protein